MSRRRLAVLAAIAVGGVTGAINGTLITRLRVTPFIVTLGMLGIAARRGKLAGERAGGQRARLLDHGPGGDFPRPGLAAGHAGGLDHAGAGLRDGVILRQTVLGRYIVAIGSNETTSRLSGLRVDRSRSPFTRWPACSSGWPGRLQFGRLGQGDPTVDVGAELDVIAAVVIGGGSLSGGEGSVLGSLLGALIMALLRNGSQQMGWPAYVQQIIIGIVIIAAVALDRLRHRAPGK